LESILGLHERLNIRALETWKYPYRKTLVKERRGGGEVGQKRRMQREREVVESKAKAICLYQYLAMCMAQRIKPGRG
jgi:hypothetical protein